MSDKGQPPEFPKVAGHERLSDDEKGRIADAAWSQSNGNVHAFGQLCAEHFRGEINLFSDNPTAIRVRGTTTGVGSDRLTATGGETHNLDSPANALPAATGPAAPVPPGSSAPPPGSGLTIEPGAPPAGSDIAVSGEPAAGSATVE